ncbi:MbtH family protein [Salicibibacter cibarius]|uniref:MbtH family protein n=1 Tax=Salicibibacter cibarius TaxID=2743000 RepID=A0A7T6Z6C6_9BACI|nr:MbtH family NRPS accessory protein [Salicibibacter cibarius]QQK77680.1 MbtH family protein [Salicibibacter cibarius]
MNDPRENEDEQYRVLMNQNGQYSIWRIDLPVPDGWTIVFEQNYNACLEYIDTHWKELYRPDGTK